LRGSDDLGLPFLENEGGLGVGVSDLQLRVKDDDMDEDLEDRYMENFHLKAD
jgi:hypothetical protein